MASLKARTGVRPSGGAGAPEVWVDCAGCGSSEHEEILWSRDRLHRVGGQFRIVRCRDCGLAFLNPRLDREALRPHYPPHYPMNQFRPAEPGEGLRRRLLARTLARMDRIKVRTLLAHVPLGPDDAILDVGCGLGSFLAEARRRSGCRPVGIEPAPTPATYARDRFGLDVHHGFLDDFESPPATFRAITLWHVLEHQEDVPGTLERIRNLLVPGGRLVVELPDFSDPLARVFRGFWCNLELPRHLVHFTPRTLRATIERAGYEVVTLRRGGAMPPCSVTVASLFAVFGATYDKDLAAYAYATEFVWRATWPLFALEGLLTGRGVMTCVARPM